MDWQNLFAALHRFLPTEKASAHCDIPCGIYDPHSAQIAALTVLRMTQLIEGLKPPSSGADANQVAAYENSLSRYIEAKEEHAENTKKELAILWGDYFKPEHLEKYPDVHATFWSAIKLASKNKQEANRQAAEDLVAAVQKVSEVFWASKGAQTRRQPSLQMVGGEIVYPLA